MALNWSLRSTSWDKDWCRLRRQKRACQWRGCACRTVLKHGFAWSKGAAGHAREAEKRDMLWLTAEKPNYPKAGPKSSTNQLQHLKVARILIISDLFPPSNLEMEITCLPIPQSRTLQWEEAKEVSVICPFFCIRRTLLYPPQWQRCPHEDCTSLDQPILSRSHSKGQGGVRTRLQVLRTDLENLISLVETCHLVNLLCNLIFFDSQQSCGVGQAKKLELAQGYQLGKT